MSPESIKTIKAWIVESKGHLAANKSRQHMVRSELASLEKRAADLSVRILDMEELLEISERLEKA